MPTDKTYAAEALLPEGVRDDLAPTAEFEAGVISHLLNTFASYGYDRVSPPLIEYEESLLRGGGATKSNQMFRLMDAETQRMMALRADMTIQVSRIAATRLTEAARPLRLAYAGPVLRTKGGQLRPSREFWQAGVELFGDASLEAEAEVILLAAEALIDAGVEGLSLDLTAASLVPMVARDLNLSDGDANTARRALDQKDIGSLASLPGGAQKTMRGILSAAGEHASALSKLADLDLGEEASAMVERLSRLVSMLLARKPDLAVTIDPGESHGFEYKTGIGFALFARGVRGELGRGGRYVSSKGEEATGFSVYLDSLLRALPAPEAIDKIYLPFQTASTVGEKLRKEGGRTVQGLTETPDLVEEARRLGCSHFYDGEGVTRVK